MVQSVTKQFQAALLFLFEREGRGAQSLLSGQQKIDRGYLNAIIKGRKPGSEEVRTKIAAYFHMTYEEMLALGRRLTTEEIALEPGVDLGGHGGAVQVSTDSSANDSSHQPFNLSRERETIAEKIRKTIAILESGTSYRDALDDLIDAFYNAIGAEGDNLALRNQVRSMESRIASLEKELALKKEAPRKSA